MRSKSESACHWGPSTYDDWSWLKGRRYGTVVVDLERRVVVDVLPERSADATADWLSRHPEVEVVSRGRCGLYAQEGTGCTSSAAGR